MQLSDNKLLIQDYVCCTVSNKTATIHPNWVNKSCFVASVGELVATLTDNRKTENDKWTYRHS